MRFSAFGVFALATAVSAIPACHKKGDDVYGGSYQGGSSVQGNPKQSSDAYEGSVNYGGSSAQIGPKQSSGAYGSDSKQSASNVESGPKQSKGVYGGGWYQDGPASQSGPKQSSYGAGSSMQSSPKQSGGAYGGSSNQGGSANKSGGSYDGKQVCMTRMGEKMALYSTGWHTQSTECTITVSTTSTKTLPTVTNVQNTTITVTTSVTTTDTNTVVEINTSTILETTTKTDVVTTTTSIPASTSTVPTSLGFIPIQTSLPGSTYGGSGGNPPVAKRNADVKLPVKVRDAGKLANSLSQQSKIAYPQEVQCTDYRPSKCATTTETITRTESPTVTITNTHTEITTSSVGANATTTVTSSTSTISTIITTTTSTETDIIFGTTTTVYAACATNNLADNYLGQPIGNAYYGQISSLSLTESPSAYDCCVTAMLTGTAGGFFWLPAYLGSPNQCAVFTPSTCAAGQTSDIYQVGTGDQGIGQDTAGNAYCAQYNGVL